MPRGLMCIYEPADIQFTPEEMMVALILCTRRPRAGKGSERCSRRHLLGQGRRDMEFVLPTSANLLQ